MNIFNCRQSLLRTSFKGYDVIPLSGLYMQGLRKNDEYQIFEEMRDISQKEGLDLFVNQNNTQIKKDKCDKSIEIDSSLSVWAQDNKAFIKNGSNKFLLCNSQEKELLPSQSSVIGNYNIVSKKYMPRGGNYYLGYKKNGEKWLLINSMSIVSSEKFKKFGDTPTKEHLTNIFDVKPENIVVVGNFLQDLDMEIRPIGYPYILVNDYTLALENLEKMKKEFPESVEIYNDLKSFVQKMINAPFPTFSKNMGILKSFGFKPIRIAGIYSQDINFMNAIALKKNDNTISYIINSTKNSLPELEYLEKLFEKELREKVSDIGNVYFVSGGKSVPVTKSDNENPFLFCMPIFERKDANVMMKILANRLGGIHCMSAEIPDPENFEKNVEKLKTLSHRNWCTKSFNAEPYLAEGDFHVYLENGTPKLGVRFVKDKIREIQSEANNGKIPITYYEVFRDYSKDKNFKLTSNAKTQIARAENVKKNVAKIRKKLGDSPNIKSIDDARLVLNALGIKIIEDTSIETKFLDFLGVNKNKDTDKLLCIESYEAYRSEITCKDLGIKENDLFKYIEEIQHYLSLRDSDLTDLGSLKKIGGNLTVANSNIQSLGKLEYIGGNADFENSKIRNTGALKKINCSCTFNNSEIEDLGDLEYIGGLLNLKDTQIKQLKSLKYIGSDLCLNGSKVEDFGELKYVGGNVVTDYGSAQRKLLTNAGIEIKGYVLG